ncbi:MAG TPA: hypothetical protein VLT33_50475 [Labilithrix sp.]|nr:hypothetical protein [Labilithrix sp.]
MFKREALVFVLLAVGVALSFGGFALISRGSSQGWIAVAIAAPMLLIAQRSMRVVGAASDTTEPSPKADARE